MIKRLNLCYLAWANSSHTYRKINWFAEQGHKVHLITNSDIAHGIGDIKNISIHRLPYCTILGKNYFPIGVCYEVLSFPYIRRKVKSLIHQISPDILHSHNLLYPGWIGALINFHPFVVSPMNGDVIVTRGIKGLQKHLSKSALKRADLVTAISGELISASIKLGAEAKKCRKLHWGFELDRFNIHGTAEKKDMVRSRLGIDVNCNVVLCTRSVSKMYDTETIVRAVPYVIQKFKNTKFIFIWHAAGRRYLHFLKELAEDLGVQHALQFRGSIPRNQIHHYYKAADVSVSTSLWDGGPNSVIEAMICGNGVVAAELPIIREYKNDEGFKFEIVPRKSPSALADRIIEYFKDADKVKEYATHNFKIAEKRFNYNKNMKKLEQLYYSLI